MRSAQDFLNRILFVLALVFSLTPASLFASTVKQASCGMPCCQPKQVKPISCCTSEISGVSEESHTLVEIDRCECKIDSLPATPEQPWLAISSVTTGDQAFSTPTVVSPRVACDILLLESTRICFSSDSDPPDFPARTSLGRAPPVTSLSR
jgi:hypothetical protein